MTSTHAPERHVGDLLRDWRQRRHLSQLDLAERLALLSRVATDDVRYVDPLADVEGRAAIDATIAAVQGQFPGFVFRLAGPVDAHHDQLRFAWELVGPDNAVALTGLDVGELAPDGRLLRITGFFGDLPARDGG